MPERDEFSWNTMNCRDLLLTSFSEDIDYVLRQILYLKNYVSIRLIHIQLNYAPWTNAFNMPYLILISLRISILLIQVVKYLIAAFNIINSTNNQGNVALYIAAYRGQSSVVEALIVASPSLVTSTNNAGETFLHMAVPRPKLLLFKD